MQKECPTPSRHALALQICLFAQGDSLESSPVIVCIANAICRGSYSLMGKRLKSCALSRTHSITNFPIEPYKCPKQGNRHNCRGHKIAHTNVRLVFVLDCIDGSKRLFKLGPRQRAHSQQMRHAEKCACAENHTNGDAYRPPRFRDLRKSEIGCTIAYP